MATAFRISARSERGGRPLGRAAVACPERVDGLTYFEVTNLLKGVAAKGPVLGVALVGIVPAHDLHARTSLLGARLLLNLVGACARTGPLGVDRDHDAAALPSLERSAVASSAIGPIHPERSAP
jgi:hypothetical protein